VNSSTTRGAVDIYATEGIYLTAPTIGIVGAMTISSTALVTNLNADTVDGADYVSGTWTPSWSGFSSAPVGVKATYMRIGKLVVVWVSCSGDGTSNAATLSITNLPITSANNSQIWGGSWSYGVNNGAVLTTPGRWNIAANSATIDFYTNQGSGGWATSAGKRVSFCAMYEGA